MHLLQAGGPGFVLAIVAGLIGVGLSLGAIVAVAMSKHWGVAMGAGVALLLTAMCTGCTGVFSYGNSISRMNRALEYSGIDPAMRRALEQQGTFEASIPLMAGIGGSLVPGITGLACAVIATRRRSQPVPID